MTPNAYTLDTDSISRVALLRSVQSEELQEFSEGDWVKYGDSENQVGVIVSRLESSLDWPTGDEETETVEPGEDDDGYVYVVGRLSGGSKPFVSSELESANRDEIVGDEDEMPDEPESDLESAEMGIVYYKPNDPHDRALFEAAVEELINIPGVDDPGVGFDSWPDSWEESEKPARLIALDAWSSMGGTWTGCFAEIGSRRLCAAFKDEILGTERWRNRF